MEGEKENGVRDASRMIGLSNRRPQLLFSEMGKVLREPGFMRKDGLTNGHGKF